MRNVLVKFVEINGKSRFLFCKFFHKNRDVYVIKWKNMVDPCRPHVAIWYSHAGHTWQYGTAMQATRGNMVQQCRPCMTILYDV